MLNAVIKEPNRLLDTLLLLTPPLLSDYRPGTRVCVLSTRVMVEVLSYFGYTAKPWPCRVVAMNAVAARGMRDGWSWPDIFAAGGFSLGQTGSGAVRYQNGTWIWDGHLVTTIEGLVEEEEPVVGLLDACLGDYARPEQGVHTAPLRAQVSPRLMASGQRIPVPLPANGVVLYEPIHADAWTTAPDWTERSRWSPLAAKLIRTLSKDLR